MPDYEGPDLGRIVAREYKLMLRAGSFRGGADQRMSAVEECWRSLSASAWTAGVAAADVPKLGSAKKQRLVRFYDTDEQALYRCPGFIFRLRRKIGSDGPWDTTLKFRGGNWVRASAQSFKAKSGGGIKFEEDVKARPAADGFQFMPLFSRSADMKTDQAPTTVGECLACYKELGPDAFHRQPSSSVC